MKLRALGYVGQNLTLGLTTGRTLRLANLTADRVVDVIRSNLGALRTILEWNARHGIRLFRIGSSLVPFASHERFPLDWRAQFASELDEIRAFATAHGIRLTMHPGQYTVLNSTREAVVRAALAELDYHARLLDAVAPEDGTMTVHVGGVAGDREAARRRFVNGVRRLSPEARARLVVENDDRRFDLDDALGVARELDLPVVLDLFHHRCLHRRRDPDEGLPDLVGAVVDTWRGRVPKMHLSSPREEGATSHADHVRDEDMDRMIALMEGVDGDDRYDLVLEAKHKERAVLRHLDRQVP